MFSLHSIQFHLDKALSCKVKVNMLYSSMSFTWRTWCLDFHVLNLGSFHVRSVSWLLASFATAKALFIFIAVLFTVVKLASTIITILSCSLLIWLTAASFGLPVKCCTCFYQQFSSPWLIPMPSCDLSDILQQLTLNSFIIYSSRSLIISSIWSLKSRCSNPTDIILPHTAGLILLLLWKQLWNLE